MNKKLQPYRTQIDEIDDKILDLLAQRFNIVRNVGQLKTAEDITIIQSERVDAVINRTVQIATEKNIPAALIRDFYTNMIDEAHKIEFAIKDSKTDQQEASQAESLNRTLEKTSHA